MIWFTADNHYGHHNIIKYCNRPFQMVHEMNKVLTEKWNEVVAPSDTVYIVGDFAPWKDPRPYLSGLYGKKIFIKGNHDKDRFDNYFDECHQRLEMQIGPYKCLLHHIPLCSPEFRPYIPGHHVNDFQSLDFETYALYDFFICGHVHDKWTWQDKCYNVGVDVNNLYPISIDKVLEALNVRKSQGLLT